MSFSSNEYEYITVAQITRKNRSATEPPEFSCNYGDDLGYSAANSFSRVRSNALFDTPKPNDTGKPRKKSIELQHHVPNFSCLKGHTAPFFKSHFKSLGKKSNTVPKPTKSSKDKDKHSHTSPRQPMPIPTHNFTRSKSVEDLEINTPLPITPLQIPYDILMTHGLSKSKSSSMNILNLAPKKEIVSSPLTNNGTTLEQNSLSSIATQSDSLDSENIYEVLDEITKQEILDKKEADLDYITFSYSKEGKLRTDDRFHNERRPPAPLPYQTATKVSREYGKPVPPQKPSIEPRIPSKLTENTLDDTRHKSRQKLPLYKKSSKEGPQQDKSNPPKIISTDPNVITSLTRNSSIQFTIPIKVSSTTATAVPLYSLQRSADITSELTDLYASGFDELSDGEFSEGEDSLLYSLKPLKIPSTSILMESSLPSIESSDYATYDKIIKDINTYSKQATSLQPVESDYVTYDNVVRNNYILTRPHSIDLDGYVTTEMLHSQKPKFSLPNTETDSIEYVNSNVAICKGMPTKSLLNRPNKVPKPGPRNSTPPKPSPRMKPEITTHKPVINTTSFEDPGYIGEDALSSQSRLMPGRASKKELVQSFHEYADSQIIDTVGDLPGETCFPAGGSFFKSSKRRKSILKPSRISRDSSVYTNFTGGYIDDKQIMRGSRKGKFDDSEEVEYDYIARTEIRIPFRVSWAPLFFNDDFTYVTNMEIPKLLSALNVTNHINEGWDFHQYSTIVNSKASKQPPPIYPKTDSLLRENNKLQMMPFRPSLHFTPEDESVLLPGKHRRTIFNRTNRISFRSSFPIISQVSFTDSNDTILESPFISLPIKPSNYLAKFPARGKFPSKPMLPPSKEAPELNASIPETTFRREDVYVDYITRSFSESKIEHPPDDETPPEIQSHTLDRYNRKQKKHKPLCSTSKVSESNDAETEKILLNQEGIFSAVPTKLFVAKNRLELVYATNILLEEDNIIKVPFFAVSLQIITTDSHNLLKKIGVHEPIEFVIKIFSDYSCWDKKLDTAKKGILREKSVNLSPIVSISCNRAPPPNLGSMLLTIPICGHIDVWKYELCHRDLDSLYPFEKKDESTYKLCDDRVEISTPLFGYYCIKGKYTENCVKKVVFIAFRALFDQNKILIGMSNDTPDDIKLFKEEMHVRHFRAINTEPCQYKLSYTQHYQPLKLTLKIHIQERDQLDTMEIPFMQAWRMVPNIDSSVDDPPTPSCVFTVPTCSHKLDLTVRHGRSCTEFSLNT